MMALYEWCRDRAACFVVYLAEAHTTDGWQMPANEQEGFCLRQPATFEERCAAARLMHTTLGLTIPTLVDGMDDAAAEAFAAWPERIYLAGADGRIAYKSAPGPWGFRVREAAAALQRILAPVQAAPAPALGPARANRTAGEPAAGDGMPPFAPLPTLRAQRRRAGQPLVEMEDVVDARQQDDGRVYLRSLMGEERIVAGYIGGVSVVDGRLVLVDGPGEGAAPPSGRATRAVP